MSRYQKGETNLILLKQMTVSDSGISVGPYANMLQTDNHASTLPLSFYMLDALPVAQPAASEH